MGRFTSERSASTNNSTKEKTTTASDVEYTYQECIAKSPKEELFEAAKTGKTDTIFDLFMRRQELTVCNKEGNTALHLAAQNGQGLACRMLVVLSSPEAIWKIVNQDGKTAEEVASLESIRDDLHNLRHVAKKKHDVHNLVNDLLCDKKSEWQKEEKVAICFDGGGARGFIISQILLHVEAKLDGKLMDYVDWIGGTSCGGILGLMLATGSSLQYFRHALFRKRLKIFCGNKGKFPKHSARGIENVNKQQFGDARMSTIRHSKVFVTVADSRKTPMNMILFRNYQPRIPDILLEKYQFLDPERILVWKAARCTSAAPYYFDSFHGYTDGGIVANNPTLALLSDFTIVNKLEKYFGLTEEVKKEAGCQRLGCVISLGTGAQPIEQTDGIDLNISKVISKKNPWKIARNIMAAWKSAKNMMQVLIKECTASNGQPVRYAREWCHSMEIPYFRFTPQLSSDVPLDTTEVEALVDMLWEAEVYIHGEASSDLERLVRLLKLRKPPLSCSTARPHSSHSESTCEMP